MHTAIVQFDTRLYQIISEVGIGHSLKPLLTGADFLRIAFLNRYGEIQWIWFVPCVWCVAIRRGTGRYGRVLDNSNMLENFCRTARIILFGFRFVQCAPNSECRACRISRTVHIVHEPGRVIGCVSNTASYLYRTILHIIYDQYTSSLSISKLI